MYRMEPTPSTVAFRRVLTRTTALAAPSTVTSAVALFQVLAVVVPGAADGDDLRADGACQGDVTNAREKRYFTGDAHIELIFNPVRGELQRAVASVRARLSRRVRQCGPRGGDLGGERGAVRARWVGRSGRGGAADVQVGGCGAGGDAAGGVPERLPGLNLWSRWRCRSVVTRAVPSTVRAQVVGGGPGGFGERGGGGTGADGADQGAAGGGERQVPGPHALPGTRALGERRGDGGGGASGGADEFGGGDPGGVLLADQFGGGGAQDRPGARSGVVDGRLGLPQRGLGAVPAPLVGGRELVCGVGGVVE